jgi:outer membrane murein-binding lipoprotein Lpp
MTRTATILAVALSAMLVLAGCDPGETDGIGSTGSPADALVEQLESDDVQTRLDACAALAAHGREPLTVGALYRRLADDDEIESVKLAAVRSLCAIGGPVVAKHVQAYFVGRPERIEAWLIAGDWLVQHVGVDSVVAELSGMVDREDYDRMLVLDFARRHPEQPRLVELAERIEAGS